MASLTKTGLLRKHMFRDFLSVLRVKRCSFLQIGSFVFIARSEANMAKKIKVKETLTVEKNPEMEVLESKFGWIRKEVPCFTMNGNDIRVILEPCDFYGTFKNMIRHAKRRIVIASLYLGTGQHERELMNNIEEACKHAAGNDDFEVHILLDYTRGSRGGMTSSRTMVTPLLQNHGDKVKVYLYHTPDLRGLLKSYVPERFNEIVGLAHMKIYLVDDDVIISGANLSESYFTNRQDRYIQFRNSPQMTNYLADIVKSMASFSFHLHSDNTIVYPEYSPHPYEGSNSSSVFKSFAGDIVRKVKESVVRNQHENQTSSEQKNHVIEEHGSRDHDTVLFPMIQMGPFGINDDETVTRQLFERMESQDTLYLASGYFNLTSDYMNTIIRDSKGQFEILTASPQVQFWTDRRTTVKQYALNLWIWEWWVYKSTKANGFYGARGISGYIPAAYTDIARTFYSQVCNLCQDRRITVYEYFRSYWTFHSKGLWYYLPNYTLPSLTFIGSPNFGYRSVYRDLECQVVVMTTNKELQEQLKKEHTRLYESSLEVTEKTFEHPERYVPLWVKLVMKYLRNFF